MFVVLLCDFKMDGHLLQVPPYQASNNPAAMAIFEMLDYIVNEPPPTLPKGVFRCVQFLSSSLLLVINVYNNFSLV